MFTFSAKSKFMATPKQFSGLLRALYLLLFALLPLVYVSSLIDNTLAPRQLFASVMSFLMIAVAFMIKPRLNQRMSWLTGAFIIFLIMQFVSIAAAINVSESWVTISRYLLSFSFVVITITYLRSGHLAVQDFVKAGFVFAAIASVLALFSILKVAGGGNFGEELYEVRATFSHKNLLSSALMLSFPFAVMGSVILTGFWKKAALPLIFLMIIEMFVLRTRGVWVAMFVAAISSGALYFFINKSSGVKGRLPVKYIGIGAGLAILIIAGLTALPIEKTGVLNSSSLTQRLAFWDNTMEMIEEHPLIGVGAGNWKINFPKYGLITTEAEPYRIDVSTYQGVTHIQRPHNDFLWVWAESGPIGLLAFLTIFASAIVALVGNLRRATNRAELGLDLSVFFGIVAYLTFSFTDFPLERTPHTLLVMSLLALAFRKPELYSLKFSCRQLLPVLAVAAAFSAVVAGYRISGEKASKQVQLYNSRRDAQRIVPAVEEAINPFHKLDNFANPLRYYSSMGNLALSVNPGYKSQRNRLIQQAEADAREAVEAHPYNILALNQMGNVLKMQQRYDEAIEYYHRALAISAVFEAALLNTAEVELQRKNYSEALTALNFVKANPQNQRYIQLLLKVLPPLVKGGVEGSDRKIVKFIRDKNPQDARQQVQYYLMLRQQQLRDANAAG